MEKIFTGYINYGVCAAEKRQVWTAGAPASTATCSDEVEITIPDGWELCRNNMDELLVTAPWGYNYGLNEVLKGDADPYFIALDKDGKEHRCKLEYTAV